MNATTASSSTTGVRLHLVWDWNGTLKDDLDDHVSALNATLPALGGQRLDRDTYRAEHTMPIPNFYARLLGRTITDAEWTSSDAAFLAHLEAQPVRLREGATQLLTAVRDLGHSQSLLSLCPHSTLVREVEEAGIGHFFDRVDGRTGPSGGVKAAALTAHLDALGLNSEPQRVLLVGDAIDDADAAHANGAIAVLHTGGLHHPDKLIAAGYPLADSLDQAVALGLRLAADSPRPVRS
ncbi:HAD family hydrolase [Nocardia sp. NPDC049707]|uniref:HAD family hydrolase n=1 Tax=Nocardia sp. NPDC049707 TaxID=3154735 RepID=UPI0034440019